MRAFEFIRPLVGLYPKPRAKTQSGDYVQPSKPWPQSSAVKARIPSPEEQAAIDALDKITGQLQDFTRKIETQMKFSAAMSRCLDQGMSYEDAKAYVEACADDIKAGIQTPWRKKIGENCYQAECGCIFNSDRERLRRCGDHKSG